jgi:pilus assembly protein CpaB
MQPMKPKTLILMATAIVCGLGASYMTSRLLAERGSGDSEVEKVRVAVAKKHLDLATPLKNPADFFEFKDVVRGDEPKNAVTDLNQVKGKFLARPLRKGDALTTDDVKDQVAVIPVPPGMRAVGLRVNLEGQAGGFASLPGSRVDIISSVARKSDDDSGSFYLLENVLVLAADTVKDRPDGAIPAGVVTVALSPDDVLRVNTAKGLGTLSLALRDPSDPTKARRRKVSVTEVLHGSSGNNAKPKEDGPSQLVEEGPGQSSGSTPVPLIAKTPTGKAKSPSVPAKSGASVVAKAPTQSGDPGPATAVPEVRKHVVTIVEGDRVRKVVFVLNDDGEVRQEDVSETSPAPAATAPQPPRLPVTAPKPGPRAGQAAAAH